MVAAQDPAYKSVHEYLVDQEGTDFDTVRSLVYMSRNLVETFGWNENENADVPWKQVPNTSIFRGIGNN